VKRFAEAKSDEEKTSRAAIVISKCLVAWKARKAYLVKRDAAKTIQVKSPKFLQSNA